MASPPGERVMGQRVPSKLTTSTPEEVAGALVWAYRQVMGREPISKESWLYPLAQSAIETSHWTAMYDWNVGNLTEPNPAHDYNMRCGWSQTCTNPLHFAIYPSLGDGAIAFVKLLHQDGVMAYADAASQSEYIAQLENACYAGCTKDPQTGAKVGNPYPSIGSYVSQFSNVIPKPYMPPLTQGQAVVVAVGIVAISGAAAWLLTRQAPARRGARFAFENPTGKHSMHVQSLLFPRGAFTTAQAKAWAKSHGYRSSKADVTDRYVRLRQEPPEKFRVMRTVPFGDSGIRAVVGRAA
jgi:hypothetical protein